MSKIIFKEYESKSDIYPDDNKISKEEEISEDKKFDFSIIITLLDRDSNIQKTIESILNQQYDSNKVQIIIISNNKEIESYNIAQKYQKKYNNIRVLCFDYSENKLKNIALKYVEGQYVNFTKSGDFFSNNCLINCYKLFTNNENLLDIAIIPRYWDYDEIIEDGLEYIYNIDDGIIDVTKRCNCPLIYLSNAFISNQVIKDKIFNEKLFCSSDILLLNKILLNKKRYGIVKESRYFINNYSDYKLYADNKNFFNTKLEMFSELINYSNKKESEIPLFIQLTLIYDLVKLINIPTLPFNTDDEKNIFFNKITNITNYLSNNAIIENRHTTKNHKSFILFLKNNLKSNIDKVENNLEMKINDYLVDTLNLHKIGLDIIEIRKKSLYISGNFITYFNQNLLNTYVNIFDKHNNLIKQLKCTQIHYPQPERNNVSFLSIDWFFRNNFEVEIPVYEDELKIIFEIEYNSDNYHFSYNPKVILRVQTNLSEIGNYMINDSKILYFQDNNLYLTKYSYNHMIKLEKEVLSNIFKNKEIGYKLAIILRIIHLIFYPFFKNREIWLFNDRPMFADDNAKYLFIYSINQADNIHKYYVLDKKSADFDKMKKINENIIPFGSYKHKILYLFAKKHISSFYNEDYRNPFYKGFEYDFRKLYGGLINNKRYFIQHGIIFADVTRSLKKYAVNLSLLLCSSKLEQKSFFDYKYGYNEEVVQLLGLPRYDYLSNGENKKQILFAPTWRYNLRRNKNLFINSKYYKSIESFLNNKKLHKILNEHKYQLIFKPHPELIQYLKIMKIPPEVNISLTDSYQDLFKNSSILITDYSSIFFDFSYLKKPVIYYQPNDDYPYEKGYFDFEKMGFGNVILNEYHLIQKIQEYILSNCEMEEKYKKRIDDFFAFSDKNNCKRVYEWIKNH